MGAKLFCLRGVGDDLEGDRPIIALVGDYFYLAGAIGLGRDVVEATVESEKAVTFGKPRRRQTLALWEGAQQCRCSLSCRHLCRKNVRDLAGSTIR